MATIVSKTTLFKPRKPSRLARRQTVKSMAVVVTPHSGYHWDKSDRRFFEGWYFKVTMPENGESFALIYSIEDPVGNTPVTGVGAQVMGPGDGYMLQYSKDVNTFWATPHFLGLGACFKPKKNNGPKQLVPEDEFSKAVEYGYQASSTWHQGSLIADEEGAAGHLPSTVDKCSWAFNLKPVYGWGQEGAPQKATAGWLAALPVFEPHWQVMMAHGLASGWFQWGDKRYEFRDAPAYAEKNWGGGFPSKWCWIQCNTFDGEPGASVTAVGARRGLPVVPGVEEDVGLLGIHYRGKFIELVPWTSTVSWRVDPWGRWLIEGSNSEYKAVLEATADPDAGTPLRAPTADSGLAPFCKDTFFGRVKLTLWKTNGQSGKNGSPMCELYSDTGALEVGGGPWWSTWESQAQMKEPLASLVKLPLDVKQISQYLPEALQPPGL